MNNALSSTNLLLPGPISMIQVFASLNETRSFKISLIRQSLSWIAQSEKQKVHITFKSKQTNRQTNKQKTKDNRFKQPVTEFILSFLYALHTAKCSGKAHVKMLNTIPVSGSTPHQEKIWILKPDERKQVALELGGSCSVLKMSGRGTAERVAVGVRGSSGGFAAEVF